MQEQKQDYAKYNQEINAILSRGMIEWNGARRQLTAKKDAWEKEYWTNFDNKVQAWNERYLAFQEAKGEWVDDLATQAVNIGNNDIINGMAAMTEDAIAGAECFIVSDVIAMPDTATLMRDILNQDLLSTLLTGADGKNKHISSFTPAIFQTLQRDQFTTAESLDRIRVFQTKEDEELQARIAFIQYDQALETLKEAKKQVETSIEDANLNTWNSFRKMLVWDGFKESGDNFVKNTIVGATLWEDLYEKHTIKGYQYFKTEVKDFTADFAMPEGLDIEGLGFDGMQALLKKAMDTVPAEYKRIFGKQDKDGIYEGATYEDQFLRDDPYKAKASRYDEATQQYISYTVEKTRKVQDTRNMTEANYKAYLAELKTMTDDQKSDREQKSRVLVKNNGLFNEWVGTAPVMKKDADSDVSIEDYKKNVRYDGFGETDRLMGMFIQHKMIEGAGKAAANAPFYSKKLWNDNGSWFAAPTIRSVVDIGMTITAAVLAPGAGGLVMNMALNLVDDAVFTLADISNGMDAGDAFSALGKKAMVSVVTSKIGAKFNGVVNNVGGLPTGGLAQMNWGGKMISDSLIGSTLLKGAEIMTTNIASSAINALDFKAMFSGGDFFDQKGFQNGAFGTGAMAGVMSGMAGNFVTKGMSGMIGKTSLAGFSSKHLGDVGDISSTMGGLASTAVTYGMTGNASVNLLNTSMFGMKNGVGLFELGFGKDGMHGSLSTGGTDLNLGKLSGALSGLNVLHQNNRIERYSTQNKDIDARIAMRALYSYGDNVGRDTFNDFMAGRAHLNVDGNMDGEGHTVTDEKGVRQITVKSLGNDVNSGVYAGIVLQHESYRDGFDSIDQTAETERAVSGHSAMGIRVLDDKIYAGAVTSNQGLLDDIEMYKAGGESYSDFVADKFDSNGDNWRVTMDANGKVIRVQDDGDRGIVTIVDVNGNLIDKTPRDESIGLSWQIAKINGTNTEEGNKQINKLMWNSGLDHSDKEGWFARNSEGLFNISKYSCQNYATIIKTEKERKDAVALKELQNSPAGVQQEKILASFNSTITEKWDNDCDNWTFKNFLTGGIDLAKVLGEVNINANSHYLMGMQNNLWADTPSEGLNVYIVDWGIESASDGVFDHISAVYLSPTGEITIYNHGNNEELDKAPRHYNSYEQWNNRPKWKGTKKFYNPWSF